MFHAAQVRLVGVEVRWGVCQKHINASIRKPRVSSVWCVISGVVSWRVLCIPCRLELGGDLLVQLQRQAAGRVVWFWL